MEVAMHAPDGPRNRQIVPECKENVGLRERHMKEQMWSNSDLSKSIGVLYEKLKASSPSTWPIVPERKEYVGLRERHKSDNNDKKVTRQNQLAFYMKS